MNMFKKTLIVMKKKSKAVKIILNLLGAFILFAMINYFYFTQKWRLNEGNRVEYSAENVEMIADSPLKGKQIIFLGSSVTLGSASGGESFVEYMKKRDGIIPIKEAVSGTSLVDKGNKSYIKRMENNLDPTIKADAFICQLSTNDASRKYSLGEVSDSKNIDDFDTSTICGSIEYIICYARDTWDCPVVFYTGTYYDSKLYEEMVEVLKELQQKWDIGVINMWDDEIMRNVPYDLYKVYMNDGIHPTKRGYLEWWVPVMEEYLYMYL